MKIVIILRAFLCLMVIGLPGCGGGGGGGGGTGAGGTGDGNGGGGGDGEPADRFVVSGNADGTVTILRADPVAGFAHATALAKVSQFAFRDMIHDAVNDRIVALTSDELHVLAFNATTGEVEPIDVRDTSGSSSHLVLADEGSIAYVASGASTTQSIDVYEISSTGTLSPPDSVTLTVNPDYLALNAAADKLYLLSRADDQVLAFDIDTDGSLAPDPAVTDVDENPTALVFDAAGSVAYLARADNSRDSLQVYAVDDNGALEERSSFDVDTDAVDLVLSADGANLYVLEGGANELHHFSVDTDTGELSFVDAVDIRFDPTDLTLSHTGGELYVSHSEDDLLTTVAVNAADGSLTVKDSARVRDAANTVAAVGGNGALVPTASFLLVPDLTGLSVFEVGVDGALNLVDKINTPNAMLSGEVAVQYEAGLMFGAGRNTDDRDLLTSYRYDSADGEVDFIESVDATVVDKDFVPGFQRIELGASGRYFYVLDQDETAESGAIRAYSYEADGSLDDTSVDASNVSGGPENLTLHPAGRYIYSIDSYYDSLSQREINATTGAFVDAGYSFRPGEAGQNAGRPVDLKFHPNGRYAYVSLEDDSEMVRYVVSEDGVLRDINRESPPQDDGNDVAPGPIGVHPSGQYLYVGERNTSNNIAIYDIDPNNYSLSYRTRIEAAGNPSWIEVDPQGRSLYARHSDERVQVFTINDTGDLTDTGQVVDAGESAGFLPSMTLVAPLVVQ